MFCASWETAGVEVTVISVGASRGLRSSLEAPTCPLQLHFQRWKGKGGVVSLDQVSQGQGQRAGPGPAVL